ncbi:bifunctional diguanylate cyclase/phosphodiesterase [Marinobacter persicus]|uniref:Diguanylate cyclase (GGDEF)-like protein n=1 Tax=Marinobacter persicus TaxID=930118 RepID=A0A2S6G898_9GAMM|nr:sensor domain-containing diguanylate cyclase [Marinobacter persicus]PPK52469.1 diguanylate cyclase (GGDEF)-like protein [Marinobacter persicus]PPK55441.1 diguanylate cyclase (GGDEF)-like protein [Marinobacter persicus]PPK57914.1 diguanylate cyclase (GGDEF)-like protein [Marinobacter persicus]
MSSSSATYGLNNCDKEPIHVPGAIQPDGLLLVLDPDEFTIIQLSRNTDVWLGLAPESLLGMALPELLGEGVLVFLLKILTNPFNDYPTLQPVRYRDKAFVMRGHHNESGILVEMEPLPHDDQLLTYRLFSQLSNFFHDLERVGDPDRLLELTARQVREVTGHESVMVYRFDAEWNGQIIIEDRADGEQRFLGQHFPASDIPAQARRLYQINRIRRISNVHYTPVPLLPVENPRTGELDMTYTQLRSVSPIHREYMRNMGTVSSLTMSLMPEGRLWGMIVCHGDKPNYLSQPIRTFCKMVSQVVSENLQLALNREFDHRMSRLGRAIDRFNAPFQATLDLETGLAGLQELLPAFESDAVFLRLDGLCYHFGRDLDLDRLLALREAIRKKGRSGMASSECVPDALRHSMEWVCGYLFVPLSHASDEYLIFLRSERPREISWAGEPDKTIMQTGQVGEARISPRQSFQAWTQKIRGQSLPWERHHRAGASRLRRAINLRMASEMSRLRQHDAKMAHLATHDALTGLPNRLLVDDRLERALSRARRERSGGAVLFLDLNGFKPINDQYGHDTGDAVLQQVAERLESIVRDSDTFARFGGDEFVFVITGYLSMSTARVGAEAMASKLLAALEQPFKVEQEQLYVGASIGIALYPFDSEDPEQLIKLADQAMYTVKETGRSHYHFVADVCS